MGSGRIEWAVAAGIEEEWRGLGPAPPFASDHAGQDTDAGNRQGGTTELNRARCRRTAEPGDADPKTDADHMQQRRRQHEAKAVLETGGIDRHFGAMRVAMKDRKDADQSHGGGDRPLPAQRDGEAQHDPRGGDPNLDKRNAHSRNAERTAYSHDR